jgi:hypothetical protein
MRRRTIGGGEEAQGRGRWPECGGVADHEGRGGSLERPEVEDGPDMWAPPVSRREREGEDGVGRRKLLGRGRVVGRKACCGCG